MGGARTGGGDKPSIAPEKTLGRAPICSAAFSLRKPPRNSLILRHGVLTKLRLSPPPRCVAARSPLSPRSHALTLLVLLRLFLRVSAPPRQNHTLGLPSTFRLGPRPWQRSLRFLGVSPPLSLNPPPSLSKPLRSHFPLCTKLAIVKYSIALASLACAAACAAVLPPYELECEARRNPVGIDAPQPRLSWKLRAEPQSAYQIQVGTSPDAAGLWDSGRTSSPDTSWIAYAGPPLESFRRYWWRVRVWNAAGEPSPWSDAA